MGINTNNNGFPNMEVNNPEDDKVINAYLNALDHEVPDVWDAVNRKLDMLPGNNVIPMKKKRWKMSYIYTAVSAAAILFVAILSINIIGDPRHAKSSDVKTDKSDNAPMQESFMENTTTAAISDYDYEETTAAGSSTNDKKDVAEGTIEYDNANDEETVTITEASTSKTNTIESVSKDHDIHFEGKVEKVLSDGKFLIRINSVEKNIYDIKKNAAIVVESKKNITSYYENDIISGYIDGIMDPTRDSITYTFRPF